MIPLQNLPKQSRQIFNGLVKMNQEKGKKRKEKRGTQREEMELELVGGNEEKRELERGINRGEMEA